MRMGLHSGPVTAGVLRGERSRFQLFGDTVNTAARMEHNGVKSKIQISEETANILLSCGKKSWVSLREDKINAKGKGEMQTYWLELGGQQSEAKSNSAPNYVLDSTDHASLFSNFVDESTNGNQEEMMITEIPMPERPVCSDKVLRLIGWNVEVLLRLLKQIIARRNATTRRSRNSLPIVNEDLIAQGIFGAEMVLDEVKEIIELPQFDARAAKNQQDTESVEIDPRLPQQLEDYVMTIGSGYRDNPCKCFLIFTIKNCQRQCLTFAFIINFSQSTTSNMQRTLRCLSLSCYHALLHRQITIQMVVVPIKMMHHRFTITRTALLRIL